MFKCSLLYDGHRTKIHSRYIRRYIKTKIPRFFAGKGFLSIDSDFGSYLETCNTLAKVSVFKKCI